MSGFNDVIDAALDALDKDRPKAVRELLESLRPRSDFIAAVGIYGAKTGKPYVELRVQNKLVVQMTPADARHHALITLEAAEAAEQDAFFTTYLLERVGTNLENATALLQEFRAYRAAQREKE